MRYEPRGLRELCARLFCLCILSLVISICIVSYYDIGDSNGQKCPTTAIKRQPLKNDEEEEDPSLSITTTSQPCETVHIALICGGHDAIREFYTLLKSILFYRVNIKLRIHLFVNNVSKKIVEELFKTWIVPDLNVTLYHMSDYESEISWIPNQHYSHRYGLLKLVAPNVLAEAGLEQVIFLDTDMLAHGDIAHLWREFARFNDGNESFLGLVENQSDWYLQSDAETAENQLKPNQARSTMSWPAMGRGFNTGVMLIDLRRLKKADWSAMWRDVTETELIAHLATVLADQDIYNAVIRRNSWIVLKLDCRYNLQLNDHTVLNTTCPTHKVSAGQGFSLSHWNSPYKLATRNAEADYYNSWYATFLDWNAKLLERTSCLQPNEKTSALSKIRHEDDSTATKRQLELSDLCRDIRPRPNERLRTFLYYLNFELKPTNLDDETDVTIVVHLSMDRFGALDELASHWAGPMSVALYLSEMETSRFLESVRSSQFLSKRQNVGYHLVFRDFGSNYPINRLRNIALENALTPYVFMTDVDFLPSPNLYDYLTRSILKERSHSEPYVNSDEWAFVVPAFENNEYKFEYPTSKAELIKQLDLGTISKFRESIWPQGQAASDYDRWRVATKPYRISWRPEYEPFIVVRADVTRYDERFNGFGWNKVEHIMHLAAQGYQFHVLPEAFLVHQFHKASYDIRKHRESRKYRACIRHLKQTFLLELRRSYPEFANNFTRRIAAKDAETAG